MSLTSSVILLLSIGLEVSLLWCLFRRHLWRHYSYFCGYVVYNLIVQDFFLFGVWSLAPRFYRVVYWQTETVSVALRFLVLWEVFRHTFPVGFLTKRMTSKWITVGSLGLGLLSAIWTLASYRAVPSPYYALERGLGFPQAVLTLGILLLARYYHVPLGRNIWWIAVGFGGYVSISTVNFAVFDLYHSFLPYWQVLVPLSFNAMLAVWIWAVWDYAPNPPIAVADAAEQAAELDWWRERWKGTLSSVRKVVRS